MHTGHKRKSKGIGVGLGIAGVSLLIFIITVLANKFFPLGPGEDGQSILRILGICFGGAGVLGGIIVAVANFYVGRPADNRHAGIALVLFYSGMAAIVAGLAAAIHQGSWVILGVVVGLMGFGVWAMFWGPRGTLFLILRALAQLALWGVAFYVGAQERNPVRFSFSLSRDQKMVDGEKALYSNPEQALRLFNEVVQSDPNNDAAFLNRGRAYARLGQTERAIQDFDEAIRLNSKDSSAYDDRGHAYLKLRQIRRAILDYDQAIILSPTLYFYYEHRGKAYQALGEAEQAQRDFDKAKTLSAKDRR